MAHLILNFKHRLHPSTSQRKLLDDQVFVANQVFNSVLNLLLSQHSLYKQNPTDFKNMSDSELDFKVKSILLNRNLYGELDTRQQERNIAKKAFWDGLSSVRGFAHFRKSSSYSGAFSGVNARTTFGDDWIKLSARIGKIKMNRERQFPNGSTVKAVRIKKEVDRYYAIITLQLSKSTPIIKIDNSTKVLEMDTNNGSLDFSDGSSIKYERTLNIKELERMRKVGKGKKTKNQKRITKLINEYKKYRRRVGLLPTARD